MSKYFSGVIIGLLAFVTVRVIAGAFGLNERALRLGHWIPQIPQEYLSLLAWLASGIVGVLALILWLSFNADARLRSWWSPVPPVGSLPISVQPTMKVEMRGTRENPEIRRVEMSVPLRNKTDELFKFDAELRATVNGKDLDRPVVFNGYVGAGEITMLLLTMDNVPVVMEDGKMHILGRMRYDVRYRFDGKTGSRRTSRIVQWEASALPSDQKNSERRIDVFVRYFDEIEE